MEDRERGSGSVSPRRAARRVAPACGLAALVLCAAPGLSAVAKPARIESVTARIATDNLGCDVPGLGNHCFVVTCADCTGVIPDLGSLIRSLVISQAQLDGLGLGDCTVRRVKVAIELDHTYIADLVIGLAHAGTDVSLYANEDCGDDGGVDAVFSDLGAEAPNPCPASGGKSLRPDEPLAAFASMALVGTWTLSIVDIFEEDSGMLDQAAFAFDATCSGATQPTPTPPPPTPTPTPPPPPPTGACTPGPNVLCLGASERFKVEATWENRQGVTGAGLAVEITPDTGYLWFFNQENVEIVVKVLNGCAITQHHWVFAAGLTDVEVELVVTDTQTAARRTYLNPQRTPFQPIQDTSAFATCP